MLPTAQAVLFHARFDQNHSEDRSKNVYYPNKTKINPYVFMLLCNAEVFP